MANAIKLSVITGPHHRRRYCFRGATKGIIGRGSDCLVQLAGFERDGLISRKHCLIAVDPPRAGICDLGSANGTYVNGRPLPNYRDSDTNEDSCAAPTLVELQDGDVVTIGGTTLQVESIVCPHNAGCEPGELPACEQFHSDEDEECSNVCNWACLLARQVETLPNENTVVWEVGNPEPINALN
jgi:hypothetical protein